MSSMGTVARALDLRPQLPLPPVPQLEPLAAQQVTPTSLKLYCLPSWLLISGYLSSAMLHKRLSSESHGAQSAGRTAWPKSKVCKRWLCLGYLTVISIVVPWVCVSLF